VPAWRPVAWVGTVRRALVETLASSTDALSAGVRIIGDLYREDTSRAPCST
jgi:hypothetical protein